jgi:type IV pilus assembly protein PilQ
MRAKLAWVPLGVGIVAIALGGPTRAEERTPTVISEIRQDVSDRSTRLVVACTGPLTYTYYSPDPLTLVIDIPEVDASKVPARIGVGSREVESVRVTSMARGDGRALARLEVRLASLAPYQIFSKDKALNLVFERPAAKADSTVPASVKAAEADRPPAKGPEPDRPPSRVAESRPAEPRAAEPVPAASKTESAAAAEPGARWRPVSAAELKAVEASTTLVSPPRTPASRILGVSKTRDGEQLSVSVRADGKLRYQDFFLGNPDRLVVDFNGVSTRPATPLEVNEPPVKRARLAQFSASAPKVARLVLDLSARSPYRIVEREDGVKIVFGEGEPPTPAPLAALRPDAEIAGGPEAIQATSGGSVSGGLPPPTSGVLPAPVPAPALLEPDPQTPAMPAAGPATPAQSVLSAEKVYTGQPISLDFKDGDLQDIFRLFADISGLNIVVNPGVSGKITLKLTEVPWDQALDLILKANGLGYTLEGNVIRIARLADLQAEEKARRALAEEKALAGELGTLTTRVSYAKAVELSDVLKKAGALSARGSINVDTRTNTMIINDLPMFLDRARQLIAELDRPTPQVEIEARIVVTSRNFTRDFGIQWGFNQVQAPQFGNTTNRNFPNAIIINGQGVPAVGGISADQQGQASNAGIGSAGRGYFVNLPAAGFNTGLGISLGNILGNFNLDAALTALERQGRGRLLSTPKVTTQNNQSAEIKQGVQIPIQTVANNTVTVQFKDAVLTLSVTPQITEAGTVILNLTVENNAADFANLVNGIPPINTQSAKTQVLVHDGATAVIGGIYQSNEQTSQQSTPLLGHLPIVGFLFRNRFVTSTNNELLLFITPRIIKS